MTTVARCKCRSWCTKHSPTALLLLSRRGSDLSRYGWIEKKLRTLLYLLPVFFVRSRSFLPSGFEDTHPPPFPQPWNALVPLAPPALASAHQHRDLKLENILIEAGDAEGNGTPTVKLVDFGLSAIYQENGVSTDVLGSWVRRLTSGSFCNFTGAGLSISVTAHTE